MRSVQKKLSYARFLCESATNLLANATPKRSEIISAAAEIERVSRDLHWLCAVVMNREVYTDTISLLESYLHKFEDYVEREVSCENDKLLGYRNTIRVRIAALSFELKRVA